MKIILGTMTFSDQVDQAESTEMLAAFKRTGHDEVDTAFVYHKGETEKLLGRLQDNGDMVDTRVASKANPNVPGGLSPESVKAQLNTSLERLNMSALELFYLHSPDLNVPIRDTLAAVANLHAQGKFQRFGLSNFAAWQVAEIVEICEQEGWLTPSVYQGMYNALTRDVERELLACLRHYNVSFYAYNPLAGGMLSGKHLSAQQVPDDGRFGTHTGYRDRYWKPEYFTVMNNISALCRAQEVEPAAAAIRWLVHHSALTTSEPRQTAEQHQGRAANGIILGASSMTHLTENLNATQDGPLPGHLAEAFDNGWETVRPACIKYFRP